MKQKLEKSENQKKEPTQKTRAEAMTAVINDLAAFEIGLNDYYDNPEPRSVIDNVLTGKINSLRAFCQKLGWTDLLVHMQDMTPLQGNAVESLASIQSFIIPEARRLVATSDIEQPQSPTQWFWEFVHPRISALARPRFEAGFFGDAVEASYKEVNDAVKRIVRDTDGRELDGASLMTTAFSPQNPLIQLTSLTTETDRNIQQGYMQIMAGAMTGIRNPKAHGNLNPDSSKALHLIALASLLMHKVDERI
ncbi:MAG: TIGR02391 family protein [Syntrophaceae bacterium]|nr:TIGR02391 family protein [Syntrophaceae bacterium]